MRKSHDFFISHNLHLIFGQKVVKMKLLFILLSVLLFFLDQGASGVDTDGVSVSVMEGDSVTLNTGVVKTQQDRIRWYFNDIRIAQINGDLSKSCTDVQCNEGNGRFRDRLKLDHQTGSLTITHIRNTDSGVYQLKIFSISSIREKIFSVYVTGLPAAEEDKMKTKSVKQGEPVTLDPGVINNQNAVMTWYFKDTLIAEITGDPNKTCTDFHCPERFRDRLKLDHQTGSLTITNTRTEDSGEYTLQINSFSLRRRRSISSVKSFDVIVIDSGLSSAVLAGICVAVLLMFAAAPGVMYLHRRSKGLRTTQQDSHGTMIPVDPLLPENTMTKHF